MMRRSTVLAGWMLLLLGWAIAAEAESVTALRREAQKLMQDGQFKEAYAKYESICLSAEVDPLKVPGDLSSSVNCLRRLDQHESESSFVEKVIAAHPTNWRLMWSAARAYAYAVPWGFVVDGEFYRGDKRGNTGGRGYNIHERDRTRAVQLMAAAVKLAEAEPDKNLRELSGYYFQFADLMIRYRGSWASWRLQYLTPLDSLPDYSDAAFSHYDTSRGAPVDADGNPVLHKLPDSFEAAKTDGERWRWLLMQAAEYNPDRRGTALWWLAHFHQEQFDVKTMQRYGMRMFALEDDDDKDESGPYAVHTLRDDETIARLASGVRRFTLPDEHNFIKLYKQLAALGQGESEAALTRLAEIYQNRRQYEEALIWWRKLEPKNPSLARRNMDQITKNWGVFETVGSQPAGTGAMVEYRYRNGSQVAFKAQRIDLSKVWADVKKYVRSRPRNVGWTYGGIDQIGARIIERGQTQYLLETVAEWSMDLVPAPGHWDRRVTVQTPLQEAGAYLLTAQMADGNETRTVIWIDDTAIVRKPVGDKMLYFVADAVTGKPLAKANLEFFGFRQDWDHQTRRQIFEIENFAEHTDENGMLLVGRDRVKDYHQWMVVATTEDKRLAVQGWEGIWFRHYSDSEYSNTRTFVMTDRPVYRPEHVVKWKAWIRHAQYDMGDVSRFARQSFSVRIHNPKGEKVKELQLTADEWGGIESEYALPADAGLGVYQIQIRQNGGWYGSGSFRVEEYKKPEFEVTVEAPEKPVKLGEVIEAKIQASYLFGAPVANGKVHYKVHRYTHDSRWFPWRSWDWLYGSGYWWFANDYHWYPGFQRWGCFAPLPWWYGSRRTPPELVADAEVEIAADGSVTVKIDTGPAAAAHGDMDHRYTITAEVTDESRRTIVGTGEVIVAREPFKVYAWVDRGYYRVGETVRASFNARTVSGKPVRGKGALKLLRITYDKDRQPVETQVQHWELNTDMEGLATHQLTASQAGQYRLSYTVNDGEGHEIEGGYLFVVRGDGFDGREFRFNQLELITDKAEYAPGDEVSLMVNTDRPGATVLLFVRAVNGGYQEPKLLHLTGKSHVEAIEVIKKDMPNFFVEAVSVADGDVHVQVKEVIVPPEKRVLNVEVVADKDSYKPGENASVTVKVTDADGKPFVGSTVLTVYDQALEYISGGSNVGEIKAFFWKWRRYHNPNTMHTLARWFQALWKDRETRMQTIGVFGDMIPDEASDDFDPVEKGKVRRSAAFGGGRMRTKNQVAPGSLPSAPMAMEESAGASFADGEGASLDATMELKEDGLRDSVESNAAAPAADAPVAVRTNFADTAYWNGAITTDENGSATVSFPMPENLTGWMLHAWSLGHGTKVGHAQSKVVTKKNLLLRMQAPRFFVQKDEVVLSANIHNYLDEDASVRAVLELDGAVLEMMAEAEQVVTIPAGGEQRVDWRVRVLEEGEAVVRMKALSSAESDAMEMRFPALVHGMMKQVPFSGVIRPDGGESVITFTVPAERRVNASRLELRYSPTLAGAILDALPYLAEYPYGCTEQTLNRFLPSVLAQGALRRMGLDLEEVRDKVSNLNAQEIGDDKERAAQWKRWQRNPVFNGNELEIIVKTGVDRLTAMQLRDGGWGWFGGNGEHSSAHTTATVLRGLQQAKKNDVAIVPDVITRGVAWLKKYQAEQVQWLKNAAQKDKTNLRWKQHADNLDALVYLVLTDAQVDNTEMREFLYRDRLQLAMYGKCLFAIACDTVKDMAKRDMLKRNIEQFLVNDDENQTAYLKLDNGGYWWWWYGSEYEAHAYYLKLLCRVEPQGETASRLVKYLLNNRKHSTYWNSTRDTALVVEAFVDYLKATNEMEPDMTVEVLLDGKPFKTVTINKENLFDYDNAFVLTGDAVETGEHTLTIRRSGTGPLYWNAYLDYFTLEDYITKAGLEIKVERRYYKLEPVEHTVKVAGSRGQALDQRVEKYKRIPLKDLATLTSGDLCEIELVVESKNDYEYILLEDMKPAGFEPVEVRSGYNGNELGAYVEFRDEKVAFFVRRLYRGKHSVSYRMRAEIPGRFSALPTRAYAMYAPELKANADEIKLKVEDE